MARFFLLPSASALQREDRPAHLTAEVAALLPEVVFQLPLQQIQRVFGRVKLLVDTIRGQDATLLPRLLLVKRVLRHRSTRRTAGHRRYSSERPATLELLQVSVKLAARSVLPGTVSKIDLFAVATSLG